MLDLSSPSTATASSWRRSGVYVLAMVLHGVLEYPIERSAKLALVGAGAPASRRPEQPDRRPAGRSRSERFGRMGAGLTVLGAALHLVSIVLRGFSAGRWPLGNMYEFTAAICLAAVVTWLLVLRRCPRRAPQACSCCCRC